MTDMKNLQSHVDNNKKELGSSQKILEELDSQLKKNDASQIAQNYTDMIKRQRQQNSQISQ